MANQAASSAVASLIAGNGRYVSGQPRSRGGMGMGHREVLDRLDRAPAPRIAVLSCADLRVSVETIFDVDAGEVFTVQVLGNVVGDSGLASLEHACRDLGTEAVIVLGHSGCGAVAACCADQAGLDGHMPKLMQKIRPAKGSSNPVAENVRIQLRALGDALRSSFPHVEVVGAVFDPESARVTFMDEELQLRFATDACLRPPPPPAARGVVVEGEDDAAPGKGGGGLLSCMAPAQGAEGNMWSVTGLLSQIRMLGAAFDV